MLEAQTVVEAVAFAAINIHGLHKFAFAIHWLKLEKGIYSHRLVGLFVLFNLLQKCSRGLLKQIYFSFHQKPLVLSFKFDLFKLEWKFFLLNKKFAQLFHNFHIAVTTLPDVDSSQVILVNVNALGGIQEFLAIIFRQNLLRPTPVNGFKQIHLVLMPVLHNLNCEISSSYCFLVDLRLWNLLKRTQT